MSGQATAVSPEEVEVDLGAGQVGVVGRRHWDKNPEADLLTAVTVGDVVTAAVLVREDHKQRIVLSRSWALQQEAWSRLQQAQRAGEDLDVTVTAAVKGGLAVDAGVRGFVPASLVDVNPVADLRAFVGQTITCRVVEAKQEQGRLVLSRKAVLRAAERKAARDRLDAINVGDRLTGTVTDLVEFGAFVDLGGVRGLVHNSELSWRRVRDPSEVVAVGQEVTVEVTRVQRAKQRIGLTMRVGDDPLAGLEVGQRLQGRITRLVDFGAFVSVADDVEGLVHLSELSEHRVFHPEEVVTPGEEVWVKVIGVDRRRRRVDLSITRAIAPD